MTSSLERRTLHLQLLLSFGPVEATWRGLLLPDGHRLRRLYRLEVVQLDKLSRASRGWVTPSAAPQATCRHPS